MKEIMQFKSTKDRLKYLSGKYEEVVLKPVKEEVIEEPVEVVEEVKAEEKPKKKAPAKKKTKGDKDGKVQAE